MILLIAIFPYHRASKRTFAHASRPYEIDEHGNVLARVVKRIEGTSDTYQLLRGDLFGEPYYYRLLTNAFSMSATNPRNQRYMRVVRAIFLWLFVRKRKMSLLSVMGAESPQMRFSTGRTSNEWMWWTFRKRSSDLADFYSGINLLQPAARSARARNCAGRTVLPPGEPAAIRHNFRVNRLRRKSPVRSIFIPRNFSRS